MSVESLGTKATDKGEYVVARIDEKGGDTAAWLGQMLPGFILSIPFPESMRWMDKDIRFARPNHCVLAIYGGETVSFDLNGIRSGNVSRGHRFMSPGAFLVKDFKSYQLQAEPNFVVIDPEVRKARIVKQVEELAKTKKGMVLEDSGLVDEVTNLVEYPVGENTAAEVNVAQPLTTPWIYTKITSTGSKNLDVYFGATETLDNAEVWVQFEYMGTSAVEKFTLYSTENTPKATPTTYTTTGGTWNATVTEEYYARAAVTVNETGLARARVCIGATSKTVYVNPKIIVS